MSWRASSSPAAFSSAWSLRANRRSALITLNDSASRLFTEQPFLSQDGVAIGFGSDLLSREDLDRRFGHNRWLPMPRFEHVQPNGKQRPIDDGARFEHNALSGYQESIECCTAVQPGLQLRAVARAAVARPLILILAGYCCCIAAFGLALALVLAAIGRTATLTWAIISAWGSKFDTCQMIAAGD